VQKQRFIFGFARIGIGSQGLIYLLLGGFATLAAFNMAQAKGLRGTLRELLEAPAGRLLLLALAAGLVGFVMWRFVQAVNDPEDRGTDARGWAVRAGYAVSGLIWGTLIIYSVSLLFNIGGGGSDRALIFRLVQSTAGRFAIGIVGLAVAGMGAVQGFMGARDKFMRRIRNDVSIPARQIMRWAGRIGFSTRGITFLIIGGLFVWAALWSNPSRTGGIEKALDYVVLLPAGYLILGLVAVGLLCFGGFLCLSAWYRRIHIR
jgi:hypothetical protein